MELLNNLKRKPRVGLALGGGGARGFAHLGALKAFEEYGLTFDFVAGTSVGSLVGAFYCAGYNFEKLFRIAKDIKIKDIKNSKIVFVPSKTEGIEEIITENIGDINIEDLNTPFAAVAVDIKSTKEICLTKGNLAKAVAGSCCVPGIFQPVEHENFLLCDGGLQNTLPADIPFLFDCDYVVAIDVNKSRLYGTESTKVLDVLGCTIRILMQSNVVKGYVNADIVLKPETKRFSSTKTEGYLDMIEEGYREAINKMPDILKLFAQKPIKKRAKKRLQDELEKPVIF